MKLGDLLPKDFFEGRELFVKDLEKYLNTNVDLVAKVRSKKLQETKDSKKFLLITLEDRTGSVRVVDWYNAEKNDSRIREGDVVRVRGRVVFFENRLQINLEDEEDALKILKEDEYDYTKFVAQAKKDVEILRKKLINLVDQVKDTDYKRLLKSFFVDDNVFFEEFCKAPAGMRVHHAYLGGLLEHSVTVAEICREIVRFYNVNRDLLIAGALLHDVGKVREYTITSSGIEVTTEGELKGHIAIGAEMVRERGKSLNLPEKKIVELEHIVLSHHGELEWGSPVVPKTLEALIVHYIESLDSKLARFVEMMETAEPGKSWSEYDKNLGRRIFLRGGESYE